MDTELYNLHLEAGRKAGKDKTCGNKQVFQDEERAQRASDHHNNWENRKHDVEPYPCAFCDKWHIGGKIPVDILRELAQNEHGLKRGTFNSILGKNSENLKTDLDK